MRTKAEIPSLTRKILGDENWAMCLECSYQARMYLSTGLVSVIMISSFQWLTFLSTAIDQIQPHCLEDSERHVGVSRYKVIFESARRVGTPEMRCRIDKEVDSSVAGRLPLMPIPPRAVTTMEKILAAPV